MTSLRWLLRPLPLAVAWTLALLVALSIPADALPPTNPALSLDKVVHIGLFWVLGILWLRVGLPPHAVHTRKMMRGLLVLGGGTAFAVLTEVYQYLLPVRRHGDPYDALANVIGLLVALLTYAAFLRWRAPRTSGSRSTEAEA
jgi:VanZ family protein